MNNLSKVGFTVIEAAKRNIHLEDFKVASKLATHPVLGYEAQMASLAELLDAGYIKLQNGFLELGTLTLSEWLKTGLLAGDEYSWQICDLYPQSNRKFNPDLDLLNTIGSDGEEYVVSLLRERLPASLHEDIFHTSRVNDAAGYDIQFLSESSQNLFLEIKTSTRTSQEFNFFLSKNEWEKAKIMRNWFIVLVQKTNGVHSIFGHLPGGSIENYFPQDIHPNFSWATSKGKLAVDDVFDGLPGIR